MKKRIRVTLAGMLLFVLILSGCKTIERHSEKAEISQEKYGRYIEDVKLVEVDSSEGNNLAIYSKIVLTPSDIVDNKWLFLFEGTINYDSTKEASYYTDYLVKQYELVSKKLSHTYDVSEFIQTEDEDLVISIVGADLAQYNSGYRLTQSVKSKDTTKFYPKDVAIDPETTEMSWLTVKKGSDYPQSFLSERSERTDPFKVNVNSLTQFMTEQLEPLNEAIEKHEDRLEFIANITTLDGLFLSFSPEILPKENSKLYKMFPKLKAQREKKGYITLLLGEQLTPEEVLALLVDKGQTIEYKGLAIVGE